MPRPQIHDNARVAAFVLGASRTRYLVMRQEDVWFITFNGEEFGPYRSEREAMLFATDAAHKLGELGEETQVFRVDENGAAAPVWTYGIDPYPPASWVEYRSVISCALVPFSRLCCSDDRTPLRLY